jgi:hypothetical protein
MKRLIGAMMLAMGLVAGTVLLLAPFGKAPLAAGAGMWLAFPLGCVFGYVFLTMGANRAQMGLVSLIAGGALLLLGLAATVAEFLVSGGVLVPDGGTISLWYVAGLGFVLGGVAYSLRGTGKEDAPAP